MKKKFACIGLTLALALWGICAVSADEEPAPEAGVQTEETASGRPAADYAAEKAVVDAVVGAVLFEKEAEAEITRAEMVYGALTAMNMRSLANGQVYSDVPADAYYSAAVYTANQCGWISPGETFAPDEPILYQDAVKLLVGCLGFSQEAQERGGYPSGYLVTAGRRNLLRAVSVSPSETLRTAEAYQLMYRFLRADAAVLVGVGLKNGENQYRYFYDTNQTILGSIYHIEIAEGIVNATAVSALNMYAEIDADMIEVEGERFRCLGGGDGLLGRYCQVYYTEQDGQRVAICVQADKDANTQITVDSDDLVQAEDTLFQYYEGSRTRTRSMRPGFAVIYNGRYTDAFPMERCPEVYGSFTLLDNNGDNQFDVLFIDDYRYMVVESVGTLTGYIIADENDPDALIHFPKGGSDHLLEIFSAQGEPMEIYDLAVGSVAAARTSLDGLYARVQVLDGTVSGTIDAVMEDGALHTRLRIDGMDYAASPYFMAYYFNQASAGMNTVFSLGIKGDLVHMRGGGGDRYRYGYVIAAKADTDFSTTVRVKMLTQGGVEVLECDGKVRMDEENGANDYLSGEGLYSALQNEVGNLIRYRLGGGKIKAVDRAEMKTELTHDENEGLGEYDFSACTLRYKSDQVGCPPYFDLNSALLFKVPYSGREEEYAVTSASELVNDESVELRVFDLTEHLSAKACILIESETSNRPVWSDQVYIVDDVRRAMDEEGTLVTQLQCWNRGTFSLFTIDDEVEVVKNSGADIKPGDIVRLRADASGRVERISLDVILGDSEVAVDPKGGAVQGQRDLWQNVNLSYMCGKVYAYDGNYITISAVKNARGEYDFSPQNLQHYAVGSASGFAFFDPVTHSVRPSGKNEILSYMTSGQDASYVVLKQKGYNTSDVFIYDFSERR